MQSTAYASVMANAFAVLHGFSRFLNSHFFVLLLLVRGKNLELRGLNLLALSIRIDGIRGASLQITRNNVKDVY